MACYVPPSLRDVYVRLFRAYVYRHVGFVEFPHQAEFRLATEGYILTTQVVDPPDEEPLIFNPERIRAEDYPVEAHPVRLMVACEPSHPDAFEIGETNNYARYEWRLAEPRVHLVRRRNGDVDLVSGVIAHKATDMASFKAGKSKHIGMWLTGFACLPGATVDLVGLNYATSEHEFNYLTEALLAGTKPVVPKPTHHYDDVRNGRMYLELPNGCSYMVRSWQNKDALRGGQITCYCFNEIYQLPGLEVWSGHQQNLRAEKGYSAFTSTPDRPWVKKLHEMGHGTDPDWHCSCDATAYVNPFTFDLTEFMNSAPDWATIQEEAPELLEMCQRSGLEPRALMSRESFMVSWLGKVGGFVGRVYPFNKHAITCDPGNTPAIWKASVVESWNDRQAYLSSLRGHHAQSPH